MAIDNLQYNVPLESKEGRLWLAKLVRLLDTTVTASGVSSFGTPARTGPVVPIVGDYSGFYDSLGAAAAAQAASQPLDADLTAIAALATTAIGRSLLAALDATALRTILALGTAAVAATGDFDPAGSAAAAQAAAEATAANASNLTSGTVNISRLPPAALFTLVTVADQTARYALTTASVQNGDTVKQTDATALWLVVDDTNLGNASGYQEYTASTDWSVVANIPADVSTLGATGNVPTATKLAVARLINGVSFDGSANVTVTAEGSTLSDTVPEGKGGTNQTTYAAGDILYASAANTLAKLAKGSDADILTLASGLPLWAPPAAAGAWETVFDHTVSGGAVTSVATGTILDGDVDEVYQIFIYWVQNGAPAGNLNIVPNNDLTANNYFYQQLTGSGAAVAANNATNYSSGLLGPYNQVAGGGTQSHTILWAKTGSNRTSLTNAWNYLTSTTMQCNMRNGGWKDTATNITSITFTSTAATAIANGSRIVIMKKAA